MGEKKHQVVASLDAMNRHSHFIKIAADRRSVWALWSEGWALYADDDGTEAFPIWPEKVYADLCAIDQWSGYEANEIDLDELEELIPRLRADQVLIAVFPTPNGKAAVPTLDQICEDLRLELSRIE